MNDTLCVSNNFAVEMRIQNNSGTGGISDFDVALSIFARTNSEDLNSVLYLIDTTGRQQFNRASVCSSTVSNIPQLLRDVKRWRTVKIEFANNSATFSIDGVTMVVLSYTTAIKTLTGVSVGFKGGGDLDWIRVLNNNAEVWREDFNSNCFTGFPDLCNLQLCNDTCYWRVTGNTILSNGTSKNNILGTLNNESIQIKTNNVDRGIISADGNFGWKTSLPSTLFHINCQKPAMVPSAIRLENLSVSDEGYFLVVDQNGYVIRDRSYIISRMGATESKTEKLQEQINELSRQINLLKAHPNVSLTTKGYIKQNVPNPFTNNTSIEYGLEAKGLPCYILHTDLEGKQLQKVSIATTSKHGYITIDCSQLKNGLYLYSFIVGNDVIDTKKLSQDKLTLSGIDFLKFAKPSLMWRMANLFFN